MKVSKDTGVLQQAWAMVAARIGRSPAGKAAKQAVEGLTLGYTGIVLKPFVFDREVLTAIKYALTLEVSPLCDSPNMGCAGYRRDVLAVVEPQHLVGSVDVPATYAAQDQALLGVDPKQK